MSKATNRNDHTRAFAGLLAELCRPNTTGVSEPADNYERVYLTTDTGAELRVTVEDMSLPNPTRAS